MNFLVKAKSLFLLHLSKESIMLLDRTGWTTNLIRDFEPKESYDEDFKKSLELLSPLQTLVLHAPNQLHRLAYTYSLFRVYGVYLLAAKQIFEFSKARMAQSLMSEYARESEDIRSLSDLRVLNANFFSGGESTEVSLVPTIHDSIAALNRMVGLVGKVNERPYQDAVQEFLTAAMNYPMRLGYRLRTWFLLLVYDGVNLYSRDAGLRALTSFNEQPLVGLMNSEAVPEPVRRAATLGVEYLRNYPLKYFLLEDSKIPTNDACSCLLDLARLVSKP
jgi:hypothetical protein